MIRIKCPDRYTFHPRKKSVFLAGGITNCPNWQEEANLIGEEWFDDKVFFVNPRRDDFDVTDPTMSEKQIAWEHSHLRSASHVIFWFPEETLCPITLFELGVQSERRKFGALHVGCHPNYARRFDVIEQMKLSRPEIKVHSTIEEVILDLYGELVGYEYDDDDPRHQAEIPTRVSR